ncbi:MAG: gliding motility lipoprotein GldH [Saprospiraceae bacterium]|nr:gliding motility lipoprotein GldH [Saprospiraceae bacterium]
MRSHYLPLLLLLLFSSCRPDYSFQSKFTIEGNQWSYEEPVSFQFEAPDTSSFYTLWLSVGHLEEYAYQNMYVEISTIFPKGKSTNQVLSLDLADKFGRWEGKCRGGTCEVLIPLQTKVRFRDIGTHEVRIRQNTRDNPLESISSFTLALQKNPEA